MLTNRRTKITVETLRVVLISDGGSSDTALCGLCGAPTRWVTPDSAAAIVGITAPTIHRWVEDQRIHFVKTPAGLLHICLTSLCESAAMTRLTSETVSDAE